ncbi:DUF1674-domain-containing protein [Nemania serpens]|nr:DUF1674-domain-containing protein [Nemania serpens]
MATRIITRLIRPVSHHHPISSYTISHLGPSPATATSTSRALRHSSTSTFSSGPSPPRLSPHEQAEFERLQRTANTQAGFTATSSPDLSADLSSATSASASDPQASSSARDTAGAGPPDTPIPTPLRKGAPPDFEGDVNPRTGEIGGPKNEPLRWGAGGDYSFNGRVTDF